MLSNECVAKAYEVLSNRDKHVRKMALEPEADGSGARRLSRYEVGRGIGKGSYGEVFLVTHRGDGKQVRSPPLVLPVSRLQLRAIHVAHWAGLHVALGSTVSRHCD